MSTNIENILIIGSGSAGLTAAIYAARAGFSPLILTGIQPGGQLTITTDVENYPGFQDVVQGPWLMEQMQKQAENVGARIEYDLIVDLDKDVWPFKVKTDSGKEIQAETIIIATGAQARWLGIESEEKYNGKLVTTEKDFLRISKFKRKRFSFIPIKVNIDREEEFLKHLSKILK